MKAETNKDPRKQPKDKLIPVEELTITATEYKPRSEEERKKVLARLARRR